MFLIRWLWKNMKGDRATYCIALCMTVICQTMHLIAPHITQQIIDTFLVGEEAAENLRTGTDRLIFMLACMVGFTLLRCIIQYSSNLCYERTSQGVIYRVRKVLFDNIEQQDARFYDRHRTGDVMTVVTGDLEMVRHSIAWIIKTTLECVVLFSATMIYFFTIDWLMALCMLVLTPFILLITKGFKNVVGPFYVDLREKLSDMNTRAEENISGNRVVKAFAREETEIEKFDGNNKAYNEANKKAAFTWLKFFPALEITAQSLSVVCVLFGGIFVAWGRLSFGEYAAFSGLIWTLSNPMRTLGNIVNDYQRFTASANKIIELYYGRPFIVDREDAESIEGRIKGSVEFRDVSFSYGETEVRLRDYYAYYPVNLHFYTSSFSISYSEGAVWRKLNDFFRLPVKDTDTMLVYVDKQSGAFELGGVTDFGVEGGDFYDVSTESAVAFTRGRCFLALRPQKAYGSEERMDFSGIEGGYGVYAFRFDEDLFSYDPDVDFTVGDIQTVLPLSTDTTVERFSLNEDESRLRIFTSEPNGYYLTILDTDTLLETQKLRLGDGPYYTFREDQNVITVSDGENIVAVTEENGVYTVKTIDRGEKEI